MVSELKHALKILRANQLCERVGLSRSQIYGQIRLGKFPPPIKLGLRASGWYEHEIDNWLANRSRSSKQEDWS